MDIFVGLNGVRYRGVPLYIHQSIIECTYMYMYVLQVIVMHSVDGW